MNKGTENFTRFVNRALRILLFFIVCIAFEKFIKCIKDGIHPFNIVLFSVFLIIGAFIYIAIEKKYNSKVILLLIMLGALLLRILWIMSINSRPVSDFDIIYNTAANFLKGDYSAYKGHNYIARFPHLTVLTLYFAAIQKFFTHHLIVSKIFNCIFSTLNVLFVYLIAKEVFNSEKRALWGAYLTAIYPPMITYTAVYCSENIAIPFYLASVYYFISVVKGKRNSKWLLFSALLLSIGNLFRMVAQVMIIAYLMYIFIYTEKSLKEKGINCLYILAAFIIPLVLTSNILRCLNITEYQLWKGSEPSWTSVLKGTNIQNGGRWNEEDATLPDKYDGDYEKISKASKQIIKERLTTTPKGELASFYLRKFTCQWSEGDFSGTYWAKVGIEDKDVKVDLEKTASIFMQFIYLLLIALTYKGLYNKNQYKENPVINLFYIIYCGYGMLYLITESQGRYSFIVCWLFLILALASSERIKLWSD